MAARSAAGVLGMARRLTRLGLPALILALTLTGGAPASAEFFGCNDGASKVTTRSSPSRSAARYTHEFAAQSSRPRITIYPRRTGKRVCRSWLAREYRVSGTVIVPRQQCWWQ